MRLLHQSTDRNIYFETITKTQDETISIVYLIRALTPLFSLKPVFAAFFRDFIWGM